MTTTPSRADVTFGMLDGYWRTTSQIADRLYAAGFTWGTTTTRSVLQALHEVGKAERQFAGNGYRWRRRSDAVTAADLNPAPRDADSILGELRTLIEQAQTPPAPAPLTEPAVLAEATADTDLPDLLALDDVLVSRIVHRAAYDALKAMLSVLDGWIEGAQENCEALGHTSHGGDHGVCGKAFAPDDIRRMANDACRLMGAPEAYIEPKADVR